MSLAKRFGAVLARLRQEQGFKSPHVFYRGRGGRRSLGLSFANYLNLERGRSLPKSWRLKGILRALDLEGRSPRARELVRAYVASVLGSEDMLETLEIAEAPAEVAGPRKLAEDAARQAMTQRSVHLSLDQWRAVAQDAACYACYTYLVNTPGWVKAGELERLAGISSGALKRALKTLVEAGVVESSGGRARTPFARKWIKAPSPLAATAGLQSALYKYRQEWIHKRAKLSHLTFLTVRMEKNSLERYRHHLVEAVNLAAVYGDVEKTEGTEIYLVEGRVYGVFP